MVIQEGSRVEFLGTVPLRQRPIIINAVQVALGTLSTILSLAAVVICLREACLCYGPANEHRRLVNSNSSCNSSHHHNKIGANRVGSVPNMNLLTADQSPEGQARAYRLLRWLRQSHQHQRPPPAPPFLRRLYSPAPVIYTSRYVISAGLIGTAPTVTPAGPNTLFCLNVLLCATFFFLGSGGRSSGSSGHSNDAGGRPAFPVVHDRSSDSLRYSGRRYATTDDSGAGILLAHESALPSRRGHASGQLLRPANINFSFLFF